MSLNKGSAKKDEHIIIRQLDFGLEEVANSGSDNESSHLSASGKKINKYLLRKASDTDFQYYCEWNDCQQVKHTMNEFNHHISVHLQSYRQHLGSITQQGTGGFCFACPWRECNATIQGQMDDFSRHVFYHTFHQYLKFLGLHIQKVDKLNSCTLDTSSRNVIPELPEKLMCRWSDCGLVYDNPYIFYSHVSHHCEDYPKGSNSKIKCLWEGCDITKNLWYQMKEHMRSHTQAKVVACPTCGSLFANNTRFIDHLKRQGDVTDKKFECSHCNNRFASERILRDHMRHHVNHYKCPLCDMTCHSPSTVRDHVKYRHSDERNYKCGSCEYSGKTQTDLCRHMATHSDKGPFACKREGCEMVFITSLELRDHYKNHEDFGKQQYECHICKKRCVRGTILTTHLMEKHNYKWPSGHSKFRYRLHDDGVRRLQTIRYESIEVSEQVLSQDLTVQQAKSSSEAESAESGHIPTPNFTDITAFLPSQHQNSSKNKKCIEKAKSLKSKAPKRKGKANDLGSGGPGSKKRKTCAPKLGPVGVTQGDELMNGSIETKSSINERVSDVSSGVSEGAASIHSEHPEAIGFEKSVMAPANLLTVSCAGISGTPDRNGTPGPASIHPASLCQPKMQSLKVATDLRDADPDNESLVDPSFSSTISGSITQPAWSHFHEFSPLKVNPSLQDSLVSSDSVLRTPVKYTNEACNSSAGIVHLTCLNHKAEDSQPKNTQVWSADVASRGETDIQQLVRPQSSTMTFLHPACTTFTSYCSPSKLDSPAHVNLVSSDICGLDNKSSELYNLEMLGEVAINIQEVAREEK